MFAINLMLDRKPCLVVGGGTVALRKVRALKKAGASITIIAPTLTEELRQQIQPHVLQWKEKNYESGDAAGFYLIICAADDHAANAAAADDGKRLHILTTVADDPDTGDFTMPASIHQGNLLLTISTNGNSPELARWLRRHLEETLNPAYGLWLERLSGLRKDVKKILPTSRERRIFWRNALSDEVMELVQQGNLNKAEEKIRYAISHIRPKP